MPINNNENPKANLYYSTDGKTWNPVGGVIDTGTISVTCNLSEEDSARLWALVEGLEIVPRGDKK